MFQTTKKSAASHHALHQAPARCRTAGPPCRTMWRGLRPTLTPRWLPAPRFDRTSGSAASRCTTCSSTRKGRSRWAQPARWLPRPPGHTRDKPHCSVASARSHHLLSPGTRAPSLSRRFLPLPWADLAAEPRLLDAMLHHCSQIPARMLSHAVPCCARCAVPRRRGGQPKRHRGEHLGLFVRGAAGGARGRAAAVPAGEAALGRGGATLQEARAARRGLA